MNIEIVAAEYNMLVENTYIKIKLVELELPENLKISNIKKIKFNRDLVKLGEIKKNFGNQYLPLSMNKIYYGIKLHYTLAEDGGISSVICDKENILPKILNKNKIFVDN